MQLGTDVVRKEALSKVTGAAKYTDDIIEQDALTAKLLTSPFPHARIVSLDITKARAMPGVKAVLTGNDVDFLCGPLLMDRPPLAKGKVRYFGEPVAMVVADNEMNAKAAVAAIKAEYRELGTVNSIDEALKENPVLVHENMVSYQRIEKDIHPIENTNICNVTKIRKGDMNKAWAESEVTVEGVFSLPQSDHAPMETRSSRCKILPDGRVIIITSSQAPFAVKEWIGRHFGFPEGNVIVHVPLVGGAFGGKAAVLLEILAVLASKAVEGRPVKITDTREEDMVTMPCHLGLRAKIKLGAKRSGKLTAAEMAFYVDAGAYSEIAPRMAKAIAVDCAGPYNIENIWCDCYTVYTNHPFTTSFRGFGHAAQAFCLERAMDKLAAALGMDPIRLRLVNAAKEGDYSPTQAKITLSNRGNLGECLNKLAPMMNWNEGARIEEGNNLIRAKGVACLCKTSTSPTDAVSGVILTLNKDGSVNLNCGAVEMGSAVKTTIAQILAEKLRMSTDRIFVKMEVDTETAPKHWKTVASMTTFMMGNAALSAAEDMILQLKSAAAAVIGCQPESLEVGGERVYVKSDPSVYVAFKDLVHGYKYPNGNAIMGQIIGRGTYIMNLLTHLDNETGKGRSGPSWTVGAQAVEVEYDTKQHTYRLLKAATVIDVGKLLNPRTGKGIVMGGMCMGLGLGMCEEFVYSADAKVLNTSFRSYKMLRFGEAPDYLVDFVETPQIDAPFGARGFSEHGIIAMPAALANALSLASGVDIDWLPVTPESIWRMKAGSQK